MKKRKHYFVKKIIISICVFVNVLYLYGCSTKPTYYSKSFVEKYVNTRFDKPEFIEELSYEDDTREKNMIYEYRYRDRGGIEFSVYCGTSHKRFNASTTIFYQKDISNDYIENVFKLHENTIGELLSDLSFSIDFDIYGIEFYLEDEEQIHLAAETIARLDELLDIHYYGDEMDYRVRVLFYPVNAKESNDPLDADSIVDIQFSNGQKEKLCYDEVKQTIEQAVTDRSKKFHIDYGLSKELMQKYDAPTLQLFIDEKEMEGYELRRIDDVYLMDKLDICQDFNETPYDNKNIRHFAELVEAVGGEYQCDNWEAKWVIGKDEWQAELKIKQDQGYRTIRVWKNGKELVLSAPKELNTIDGGTTFSLDDLSLLLGKGYVINQETMCVTIQK